MRTLIVHCHPEPKSFNGALTQVAIKTLGDLGYEVEVSDLYAECFDPVEKPDHYVVRDNPDYFSALGEQRHATQSQTLPEEVRREIDRLEKADLLVMQFPMWWHAQPAMMKGWFDRVFTSGGLYSSRMRYDRGYFRGRRAICSVTTGAPDAALGPGARGGDIDAFLYPINYSLYYMGFTVYPAFVAPGVQGPGYSYQDDESLVRHLEGFKTAWAERLRALDNMQPLTFPGWADWDDLGRPIAPTSSRDPIESQYQ